MFNYEPAFFILQQKDGEIFSAADVQYIRAYSRIHLLTCLHVLRSRNKTVKKKEDSKYDMI